MDCPYYQQAFSFCHTIIPFSQVQHSSCKLKDSLAILYSLSQINSNSYIRRICLDHKLPTEIRPMYEGSSCHESLYLIKRHLLFICPDIRNLFANQPRQWFRYRGKIFQRFSVPRCTSTKRFFGAR